MLTGRPFSAREAFEWGMVNRLCDAETLMRRRVGHGNCHCRERAYLHSSAQAVG